MSTSKNELIFQSLNKFYHAWAEIHGYTWSGIKFNKVRKSEIVGQDGTVIKEESIDNIKLQLEDLAKEYLKKSKTDNIWVYKVSGMIKTRNLSDDESIYPKTEYDEYKRKASKKDQLEDENARLHEIINDIKGKSEINDPIRPFEELLSDLKERNEEVYKLFSDVLNNDKKKTIIPVLINIQYLLEIKKIEKESKSVKNVFEPQREKEIAQLFSWYLMKADKDGSLEYAQVKKIIKYINNDVLETYNIIDEDYSDSGFTFNQKNMISIGKEDNIGSVLYEYLSLPITVKKTTGSHKIKPALVKDK